MDSPEAHLPARPYPPLRRSLRRGFLYLLLFALACVILLPLLFAAGQRLGISAYVVNPCSGETIALRERLHVLPHLTSEQDGSREASLNAVGLSGLGSQGTYYLPMGTGKVVFIFANGTLDLAAGGDLELLGRGNQGKDFLFHGLAHLKLSTSSGLRGSGLTMQSRCA